jgi:membrane associated rhomboid family serine protease
MTITMTLLLIATTVAISLAGFSNRTVVERLILSPPAVLRRHQWHRLVGYGFVHADGMHLLFNMVTLYFFGTFIENVLRPRIGSVGYVAFYVAALVFAILPTLWRHRNDPNYLSLGASGAVSAVLFAFILLRPWQTIYVFVVPVPAIVFAVLYVGYTIWAERTRRDKVNHSAHLWGAAFGVLFLVALEPRILPAFFEQLASPRWTM